MYYPHPHYSPGFQQNNLNTNPYTLFLILILLVISTNKNFDERLNHISNVFKASHNAVRMMRAGMSEFQASVLNNKPE